MRAEIDTDGERVIKLIDLNPGDVFTIPSEDEIGLNSKLGKKIIERVRDDNLRRFDKGMGHLLAEACIKAESNIDTPLFYSRIGRQELKTKLIPIDSEKLKEKLKNGASFKEKLYSELDKLNKDKK